MSAIATNSHSKLRRVVELTVKRCEDNSLPYVGLENVESRTGRYLEGINEMPDAVANEFAPGDVLFGKLRPYLAKSLAPEFRGRCSGELLVLRPKWLDARFLHYWLLSDETISAISASTYGAKMPRADWDFIGNLKIPTPPLPTQRRIAAYLDRETRQIDALVAGNEELLVLLEEKRASLISHAVTRGLNPKAKLKPSGIPWLGDVPAHWEIAQVRHLITHLTSGSRGWSKFYSPTGDKFIRIGNLRRGSLEMDLDEIQHVQIPLDGSGETAERARIRKGDVLFSITAYLGSVGICPPEVQGAYVSQHVALVRVKQARIMPEWLGYYALGQSGQIQLNEASYGGTKMQLSLDDIRSFTLPCPPLEEQLEITRHLAKVTSTLDILSLDIQASITLLREKRGSLISAAVTGEMLVP